MKRIKEFYSHSVDTTNILNEFNSLKLLNRLRDLKNKLPFKEFEKDIKLLLKEGWTLKYDVLSKPVEVCVHEIFNTTVNIKILVDEYGGYYFELYGDHPHIDGPNDYCLEYENFINTLLLRRNFLEATQLLIESLKHYNPDDSLNALEHFVSDYCSRCDSVGCECCPSCQEYPPCDILCSECGCRECNEGCECEYDE